MSGSGFFSYDYRKSPVEVSPGNGLWTSADNISRDGRLKNPSHSRQVGRSRSQISRESSRAFDAQVLQDLADWNRSRERGSATQREQSIALHHPIRDHLDPDALAVFQEHPGTALWKGVGEKGDPFNPANIEAKLHPGLSESEAITFEAGAVIHASGDVGTAYDRPAGEILAKVTKSDPDKMPENEMRTTLRTLAQPSFDVDSLAPDQKTKVGEHVRKLTGLAIEDHVDDLLNARTDPKAASKDLSRTLIHLRETRNASGVQLPSLVA